MNKNIYIVQLNTVKMFWGFPKDCCKYAISVLEYDNDYINIQN
jgi:hypothetical protein